MNLLEVWIKDAISIEEVEVNNVKKVKVTFNTVCWGSKEVKTRLFDSVEEWEKFKALKYYLS